MKIEKYDSYSKEDFEMRDKYLRPQLSNWNYIGWFSTNICPSSSLIMAKTNLLNDWYTYFTLMRLWTTAAQTAGCEKVISAVQKWNIAFTYCLIAKYPARDFRKDDDVVHVIHFLHLEAAKANMTLPEIDVSNDVLKAYNDRYERAQEEVVADSPECNK